MRHLRATLSIGILAAVFLVIYTGQILARQNGGGTAESSFVGSWKVEVSIPGQGGYSGLATYMADGTTIHSRTLAQAAQRGTVMLISPAHGVWQASGERESRITFVGLNADDHGTFLGSATISGTQRLSADGQSYTGEYLVTVMDPSGAVVAAIPGTATAERITVETATLPGTSVVTPAS